MKKLDKRNWIVLIALAAVIALVFALALTQEKKPAVSEDQKFVDLTATDEPVPETTEQPAPTVAAEENVPAHETLVDAPGYLLCSLPMSGQYGILPLPEEGEASYPVRQQQLDGTVVENVLHLTSNGFWMESSTCKNQDCVGQGEVTFENREDRVLGNSVICLPNQVMVELYTAEEIAEMQLTESESETVTE